MKGRLLTRVLPLVLVESLLVSLGLVVLAAGPASAATVTITVTTTTDNTTCNGGTCSLRGAVNQADADVAATPTNPVVINIPAGTYNLTSGELDIFGSNGNITLNGTSGDPATVVINQTSKTGQTGPNQIVNNIVALVAFNLSNSSIVTGQSTTFQNLTISGGVDTRTGGGGGGGGFGGGGIQDDGGTGNALTITNCVFSGNKSLPDGAGGGGIFQGAGSLTVTNSTFTGNTSASGFGGGLGYSDSGLAAGNVSITNSTFTNNTVTAAAGSSDGGGGAFIGGATITQHATVSGSTFTGNSAGADGGGLFIAGELSTSVTTSQFVNNTAGTVVQGFGGGVFMSSSNPTPSQGSGSITLSTFTGNTASNNGVGGAIVNDIGPTVVNHNRIVGNTATTGSGVAEDVNSGSVNANDNWWGVNTGPGSGTLGATGGGTTPTATSWLQLRNIASPSTVLPGGTSTFTADILGRNAGGPLGAGTLNGLASFPTPPGVFSTPVDVTVGTASGQFVNGVATAGVTAGFTLGSPAGHLNATADNQTVTGDLNIKANSSTAIATSPTTSVFGQPVTFTATLTSLTAGTTPAVPQGGTVTFTVDGVNAGMANVTNGSASIMDAAMSVGMHTVNASYSGDGDFNSSIGGGTSQTVNKADTSVMVTSSLNPSVFTQSVMFTATISAVAPGAGTPAGAGSVQFKANGTNLGAAVTPVGGVATFSTSSLSPGSYTITAVYAGDGNFNGSTGTLATPQVVKPEPPNITKSFGTTTVPVNGTTSLSFAITNPMGNGSAPGIAFTDTLPTGLVVATPNGASNTCGGTVTANQGTGAVSLSGGTLADGGNCTVSVNVTATTAGALNNSVSVSSTGGGTGNTSTASVTAVAPPTVSKSFSPSTVVINNNSVLSFTIGNPNASQSLSGVALTDTLPTGIKVATTPGVANTCGGLVTATAGSSMVSLSGGTIPGNATCTFSVNVTGTAAGTLTNTTGNVSSTEGGMGLTASATLMVTALPVSITKSFSPTQIPLNGSTTLSFTISNPAGNGPATGIAFNDTLPAGLRLNTAHVNVPGCAGTVTITGTFVHFSQGTLADGATCIAFSGEVDGIAAGLQTNSVTVSDTEGGTGNTSTASVTVVAPPTASKSFTPNMIALNGTSTLSFTITNPNTTVDLSGVGLTDTFPAGVQVATTPGLTTTCGSGSVSGATAGSTTITLSGGTIVHGGTCTFSLSVTGTMAGTVTNTTSTVSSTEGGAGAAASATLQVMAGPLSFTKAFGAPTIPLGGSTSLTFTIVNPAANGTETGIAFTDTLPSGLVVSTPNNGLGAGACGGGTIGATPGSSTVSLTGATLTAGATCSFSVNVTGTAVGVQNNSVTASSTEGGTSSPATASVTVVAPPVLAKSFSPASIPLGGTSTLTLQVINNNTGTNLTGIQFGDALPTGMVVATPNNLSNTCGGTASANTGSTSVTLSGGVLAAGASCMIQVTVKGTGAGRLTNTTGQVASNEGGMGLAASAPLTVVAPPVIAKAFNPTNVSLGGTSTLTFTLTNPAVNTTAAETGVNFTDTFPTGMVVATPNGESTTCTSGTVTAIAGSGQVSASGITIAPGGSCTITVNVVDNTAGAVTNSVTVASTNGGTGNTAMATLSGAAPPSITKSFGATTIPVGGSTSLSFTVTNPNAAQQLTGVAFTDSLPAGLVVATPNGLGTGACGGGTIGATAGSGTVSLTGATLGDSASCTFSVNVTGTTQGQKNNAVTVSSTNGGTGNTSNASVLVVAPPQLTKAFGATTIPLNGSTSLTFTVNDPANLTSTSGIAFTDTLPAGLVLSTPNGLTGTCTSAATIVATAGSSSINFSNGSLAPNGACQFSVNVTGTTAGDKVNTTGAISSNEGGTGGTAMASVSVVAPPVATKAFNPMNVALGGTSTLTFTLSNPAVNTTAPETGVSFTDTFPTGMVVATPNGESTTCTGGSVTASAGSSQVTATGITINTGASCTITVNVVATGSGVLTNSVTPVSTNGGTGTAAMATLTAAMPPTITKSFASTTIPVGGSTTLSFTVSNPNTTQQLTGVAFTDALPAGLVLSTPNGLAGTCGGGSISAAAGSSLVTLSGATLAASASCTISVSVTGTTPGVQNNSVTVSSTEGGTGSPATASVTVVAPPTLNKAFGAVSIPLNGTATLSFSIANPNTTVALTGVGFTDTLPSGLAVAAGTLTNTCAGSVSASPGSSTVSLSGGTVAPSSSCMISVNVIGTAPGTQVNTTGNVTSTEGGTGGTATASIDVVAPPQITKAFGAANIALNASTSLTFTLTNPSANTDPEIGVAFTDNLPAGLVVATPSGGATNCADADAIANPGSGQVTLSGVLIPVGGSCTLSLNVTGTTNGIKNNSVTVSSTNGGTGNTAMATVTVALPPQIAKSFAAPTVPLNGSVGLSFTVTNPNANFALTGVAFTDNLPAGLVVSSPSTGSNACGGTVTATAGSSAVTLAGATLAGGAMCTVSVNVTGTAAGVENNTVTVTSGNAGNGQPASASITVLAPPTIGKSFGVSSIPFGQNTTLTFNLANPNSTQPLTGVAVSDTLPSGLAVANPPNLTNTCGGTVTTLGGTISLSGGTIAASATCSFTANVTAVAVGTETNITGAVSSTNGGTGLTATATLMVTRAPTTTTVTVSPANPSFGQSVTFTATVAPSGPNNSGINPTGTVSFFLNGSSTPIATVPLNAAGQATFTTSGLGAGANTVTAAYSGDTNFLPSSSSAGVTTTVTCTNTITGNSGALVPAASGSTCVIGGTISGSIVLGAGQSLDLEGVTVVGSINITGAGAVRICGSTIGGSVTVQSDTSFVVIGDAADGCAVNTINGGLTLLNNHHGVQAIGNTVKGALNASGNSGAGPFPDATAVNISGNHP